MVTEESNVTPKYMYLQGVEFKKAKKKDQSHSHPMLGKQTPIKTSVLEYIYTNNQST